MGGDMGNRGGYCMFINEYINRVISYVQSEPDNSFQTKYPVENIHRKGFKTCFNQQAVKNSGGRYPFPETTSYQPTSAPAAKLAQHSSLVPYNSDPRPFHSSS